MPALADLKHDMRDLALKAHDLVKDEKLTAAEKREQLDKYDTDIKALSEQIKDVEYVDAQAKSLSAMLGEDPAADGNQNPADQPAPLKSIGEAYTASDEFAESAKAILLGGKVQSAPFEIKSLGLDTATLKATLLESGLTGSNVIVQDRVPGIVPILFERLTVADLMPNTTTNSNVVRAVIESTATNAAATVAEGAAKPSSTLNYNTVDEPVRKIANYIKTSNEMLEDLDGIQGEISGRLVLFVRLQEEAQLLTGDGTGTNLTGILNRSGLTAAQAKGTDSVAVAVHKEITKIRVASFLDPDAVVMHPNDWEGAALEQDANGQFYGPGPFTGPYGNGQASGGTYSGTYWGLRVVVTQSMTQNTALVGAFGLGGQVVRRRGVTVSMTNTDQDDFIKNLITILAEERLALRVIRPSAFGTVTGV